MSLRIDSQGRYQRIIVKLLAVQHDHADVQVAQGTFEHLFQLTAAGGLPLTRHRRLVDPVAVADVIDDPFVITHGNTAKNPSLNRLLHTTRIAECGIATQWDLPAIFAADTRLLDGGLASGEDDVAFFLAPSKPLAFLIVGIARSDKLVDFIVDHGLHHQQARLGGGLLNCVGDFGHQFVHGEHHLERRRAAGDVNLNRIVRQLVEFSSGPIGLFRVVLTHHAVS